MLVAGREATPTATTVVDTPVIGLLLLLLLLLLLVPVVLVLALVLALVLVLVLPPPPLLPLLERAAGAARLLLLTAQERAPISTPTKNPREYLPSRATSCKSPTQQRQKHDAPTTHTGLRR